MSLIRPITSPRDLQEVMGTDYAVSDQQWQVVSAPLEPGVVIAGAGSGKTTLMAARVVYLVVTGQVLPEQILGLTFTTKAAAELRIRVRTALVAAGVLLDGRSASGDDDAEVLEPTVLTYNAYAAQLLTDHGLRIGHEPDTRVITDAARYQLGARVVDAYDGPVEQLTDHPPTAIQNLLALDSAMSEHLVAEADVRAFDAAERLGFERARAEEACGKARKTYLEPVDKALSAIDRRAELLGLVAGYRSLKAELGLMDFSDQIERAAYLARDQPDVGTIERQRFRVVLLDEYQDTSVAQAIMLSRIFSGPDVASGRGHPVTAVGDPNQAIYGWRGASVSNILGFGATFPLADGTPGSVRHLTVNRRSDRTILHAANHLAAPLLERFDQVAPLEPAPNAAEGVVEAHTFETHADELAWLAREVTDAHRSAGAWSQIGVLCRDNAHAAEVFDELTAASIPVEIVGLAGLLRLPEVAEIVALLHLMHDVTANASLLTVLAGPRWAIGARDLRLLGQRADEIAGRRGRPAAASVADQLLAIADGVDPAEIPALDDALSDPGDLDYSPQARERFGLLAAELRHLRSHVSEPLLDVVRRIIDLTGVDIELASSLSPAAEARRDNLDLFVKAVADFQAVDGDVSLAALLAYLTAEDDQGNGLDLATPTQADSVKLLTVHRSKGLEWHTVFVVGVGETRFPSNRSRTLWTSSPAVLPAALRGDAADQPALVGHDRAALDAYRSATKAHGADEELRLGYVAWTRAAHRLCVSSYCWGTRASAFGPSSFQSGLREFLIETGVDVLGHNWREKPAKGDPNPYDGTDSSRPWPITETGREIQIRRDAAQRVLAADPAADVELDMLQEAVVADWDAEIDRLLAEHRQLRASSVDVELPGSLSATAVQRLEADPAGFARDLARPMPRPPSRAARVGTRFHQWVEARFGQQNLFPDDELPGRADRELEDDADFAGLTAAFEAGPFAERIPHRVEAPFSLVLGGQVIRGRIDAVYRDGETDMVVDWKTQREATADPLQLALYRLAWAELNGLSLDQVRAAFYYVRTGELVMHDDLPGRTGLEGSLAVSLGAADSVDA